MIEMVGKANATMNAMRGILSTRGKKSVQDDSLKPAAVLVLLYPKNGTQYILLQKRSQSVDLHKGEISFPGGGKDPGDRHFLHTALRETHEEMGVNPKDVTVLGQLDDQVTRSHYGVRVFVGTVPEGYPFDPSSREIDEVVEVPIRDLLDDSNRREEIRWADGRPNKTYSYIYGEHLIFGATARIIQQFLEVFPRDMV